MISTSRFHLMHRFSESLRGISTRGAYGGQDSPVVVGEVSKCFGVELHLETSVSGRVE